MVFTPSLKLISLPVNRNLIMQRTEYSRRLKDAKRIVIKVGSARVSGSESTINDFLFSLVSDIRSLKDEGKEVIVVSSGAIAQGKKILSKTVNSNSITTLPEKQGYAAIGQSRLMKLYENFFSKVNITIAQILFGAPQIRERTSLQNLQNTFIQLLSWHVLPIVNENDSIATEELKLGDNDILSALVSIVVNADLLIILTGVDGFLVDDKLVSFLKTVDSGVLEFAKGPDGPGTGGMNTKLKAAGILSRQGIPCAVISGLEKNGVRKLILENQLGTLVGTEVPKKNFSGEDIQKILEKEFHVSYME
jgi:glutamate 5-kinase